MQGIFPMLWFDTEAEEAARFYCEVFGGRITSVSHYPVESGGTPPKPVGSVMVVAFEIAGRKFTALNGGKQFAHSEAVSWVVNCDTQEEIDRYWTALTANGGQEVFCGWLKDKYGVSWQITPTGWESWYSGDPRKAAAAMGAMMKMVKLDLAELQRAYDEA